MSTIDRFMHAVSLFDKRVENNLLTSIQFVDLESYSISNVREAKICASEASCHSKIANLTQQCKNTNYRANIERNAQLKLEKKQIKLIHLYNELNNHHQTKRAVYEFLETAFKRSNFARIEKFYKRQYAEHLLKCEKFTRDQVDRRFAKLLKFMKILTINFHILITQESKLAENEKNAENQLNYTSIFLKKETFKHERNKLLHEQMKKEKTILSLRNQLFHET